MYQVCKDELLRAYRVLNPDIADVQNISDIRGWKYDGYITSDEYLALMRANRMMYEQFK